MLARVEVEGTERITYTQGWDVENRLSVVTNTVIGEVTRFTYDGDGKRVLREDGSGVTVYLGAVEVHITGTERLTKTYYFAGSQRIAMRENGEVTYLHGDHLGSASLATNATGALLNEMRYTPYGVTRSGDIHTDRRFTDQRWESRLGLYDYGVRFYSPSLSRFVSADTIVPQPGNPMDFNRYTYVRSNPLLYKDPSGHAADLGGTGCVPWIPRLPENRYYFSEVYGYFDTGHLNTGNPGNIIEQVRRQIADGGGEVVIDQSITGFRKWNVRIGARYVGTYNVSSEASEKDAIEIALGIYMDWSHKFESWEKSIGGTNTSYAIEDLPSHYIGFYIQAYARGDRRKVFAMLGGIEGTNEEPPRDVKNQTFNPWVDGASVPWPNAMVMQPIRSGISTWTFESDTWSVTVRR